jgi:hypothetical protein
MTIDGLISISNHHNNAMPVGLADGIIGGIVDGIQYLA